MNKINNIFIVGSSRSGTTMLSRILENNASIFTFRELHFFSRVCTHPLTTSMSKKKCTILLAKLICVQKNSIFYIKKYMSYYEEASVLLSERSIDKPIEIFLFFLNEFTKVNRSSIACEHTPHNIFYVEEILHFFPHAKVINMVRDQRDVLLSQKNKWRRKFLGASKIPFFEALRSYFNYHPITTAMIWNSSIKQSKKIIDNTNVKVVKFEDFINNPRSILIDICSFLKIDFQEEMLKVPIIGSSTSIDKKNQFGIDKTKLEKWKSGGINSAEIYLSQKFADSGMKYFSYDLKKFRTLPPLTIIYLLIFPFKVLFSALLNMSQKVSIFKTVRKIFFRK